MASSDFFKDLDARRQRFWQSVCQCATRHPEWPRDGVEDFFLWWTQPTPYGRMKFELERTFGVGIRMASYMRRRSYLERYWEAHVERARGRKPAAAAPSLEQKRAAAMDAEAQEMYDRFFGGEEQNSGKDEKK